MIAPDGETAAPVKKRKRVSRQQLTREIWAEAEQAVKAVARRRGWPHETYDDLYEVVRELAKEHPDRWMELIAGFGGACSLYHYNLIHPFMDMYEIKSSRPAVQEFIALLETLEPAEPTR